MLSQADINPSRTAAASPAADVLAPAPHSDIPLPTSSALPRRAVPLTFNPVINDEANILAAISRGDRTIGDLAEEHGTTVSNFCIWLQRDDIQKKLNDLTTCGATLTRVAAVNQLPKAVKSMTFQIEAHIFDRTHNLIKPGLDADRIAALRDANARKACHLLLRLARFDPNQPVYRRRERSASSSLPQQGEVSPKATEGAPAFPTGFASAPSASSSPALLPAPLPDILDLCFSTLAAIAPESSRNPEPQTRSPIPALTSDIPLPTSDFNFSESESRTPEPVLASTPPISRSRPPPPD